VVPDYSGNWGGEYHFLDSTRRSGDGPDVCRTYLGNTGVHLPLSTAIGQSGTTISGTFDLYENTHNVLEMGPIQGSVDTSNALLLSAHTQAVDPTERSESTISDWLANLTTDGASLTGRFTMTQTFRNAWGMQTLVEQCELLNVTRSQ